MKKYVKYLPLLLLQPVLAQDAENQMKMPMNCRMKEMMGTDMMQGSEMMSKMGEMPMMDAVEGVEEVPMGEVVAGEELELIEPPMDEVKKELEPQEEMAMAGESMTPIESEMGMIEEESMRPEEMVNVEEEVEPQQEILDETMEKR
ncbi:TPA: hypothetical protein DIC20_02650 [Candidatus Dependentiae bacterium]|nr:MAG: hypothetical protein US03_C0017G0011 [candidate division TM6 bacterium GW2011_GWF2_36_131]KKQ02367.1 MAG: hypothetical protein US13_C0017G0011 [candidate division TM6 bacterium GW2011_GWE2_36_25]KKQ18646.1 MAG: hypothetical protein US32_C0023G0002 [candidate division TM6 bacterium GW2011_GWA2_36_9]HBR70976.1 hypothetical protein [Candidatus Dependentiae bacterium]HCU00579.1 hypothetical protein [Candidatus Dependentiae bacterium]